MMRNPPDGPKALDRAMERAARCDVQAAADAGSRKPARKRRSDPGPLPSEEERAGFYARIVNADSFLPANMISNSIRDAMLARGLVTPERLRYRGVL